MSTLKKSLSIILAILMLVSSVPIAGLTAFAVEADEPVFIAEEILDPMDLIQRYQEERASLNAEIDRVLADITALLGGEQA